MMKKKLLMLLTVLAAFVSTYATNGVTASAVSIPQGGTGTINIELNNDDYEFTAFTFKLTLPEGLSFVLNNSGKPTFEKSDRFDESHTVTSVLSGQVGSFGCLSGDKAAITGTSGVLLKVPVKADAALATGTLLEATLSELTFTTTGVVEVPFDDVTFNITIKAKEYTILDETSTTVPTASEGEVDVKVLRTIKANEWSTLVFPFDMTEEQLKKALGDDVQLAEFMDYEADYDGDDNVTGLAVNFVATDLAEGFYRNYPYLVKTSKEITEFIVKATVDPDEDGAVAEYDNGRTGKQRKVYGSLIGTYHAGEAIPANGLFLNGNKFWYSSGKTKIKAFRAYFMLVDVLSSAGGEAKIRITVDEKPTKIEGIGEPNVIQGAVYNVNGQLVGNDLDLNSQPKGIYVVDGKKVVNY
jgi:hypothetical protein